MSEGVFLGSVGQKTEVTNAHETVGQDVEQKAADKLVGLQGDRFFSITVFSISITQGDLAVFDIENSIIGERHTVGVAAEIIEHGAWRAEWLFRINDPILFA